MGFIVEREPQGDFPFGQQSSDVAAELSSAYAAAISSYNAEQTATLDLPLATTTPTMVMLYPTGTSTTTEAAAFPVFSTTTTTTMHLPVTPAYVFPPSSSTSTSTSTTTSAPTPSTVYPGAEYTDTPSPSPSAQKQHHGLSQGEITAAAVVPVAVALALSFLLFFLLRRRRKRAHEKRNPFQEGRHSFVPVVKDSDKDKWGSMDSSGSSTKDPVITSNDNNAYMTGLDTSSHSGSQRGQCSGEYDIAGGQRPQEAAPPPYHVDSTTLEMGQLSPRAREAHLRPVSAALSELLPPSRAHLDPPQPSGRSARSISSDLYSETASVHSARAARMSVGGPMVTSPTHSARNAVGSGSDPFGDPTTPVRSLCGGVH